MTSGRPGWRRQSAICVNHEMRITLTSDVLIGSHRTGSPFRRRSPAGMMPEMRARGDYKVPRILAAVFIVVWQFLVLLLISAGSIADAYLFMGVSWHVSGIENILATTAALVIHEIPAFAALAMTYFLRPK